jgi:hypothetical protein
MSSMAEALIAAGSPKPAERKLFDLALIEMVYAERRRRAPKLSARFDAELADARKMLQAEW